MKIDKAKFEQELARIIMSKVDFCREYHISYQTLMKALRENENVRPDTVGRIAAALGGDIERIIKD